jgi:hypothetical protein
MNRALLAVVVLASVSIASPAEAQIANSQAEFSCTQGLNNWYYGYFTGGFGSGAFAPMTQCVSDPYYPGFAWWADRTRFWTSIRSAVSFPNGAFSCGRQRVEQWAVRRWSSEVAGTVTVTGTVRNVLGGFDGFTAHILVDGVSVFSQLVAGATSRTALPYTVTFPVALESTVDFAIQPNTSDCNDHAEFTAIITSNAVPPSGLPPGAPTGLRAIVSGSSVSLSWNAAMGGGAATSYVLEAGSAPNAANIANVDTTSTLTSFSAVGVPPGTYFLRVRSRNQSGTSPPSNEVSIVVGGASGPCNLPTAPGGLIGSVTGAIVTLSWSPAGGQFTTYVIEAGSASGGSNLANFATGGVATTLVATGPPGTYFVRVRARNACGTGPASNEIVVILGSSAGR